MKRFLLLCAGLIILSGCSETDPPVVSTFRGNPISGDQTGLLRASGGPYLATDTLRVPAGQELVIEPGTELRFEPGIPFEVFGKITAVGTVNAPITFTSGQKFPSRGDWDGIWLYSADPGSRFEYCKINFGAKYGRRYNYRMVRGQLDSSVVEYGALTLKASSPRIERCWFVANGFHGIQCDSASSPTIKKSVFFDNAGHGVFVHYNANPLIENNIITENDDWGIFCSQPGEAPRDSIKANYNIVWSNFSGEFSPLSPIELGRIARANGNLDSCDIRYNLRENPDYLDAEHWDFRLGACSRAIDAGPEGLEMDGDGTRLDFGVYPYSYRPGEIRRLITVPTLLAARSPYFMSCDVFLPKGRDLQIEPGVEIRVEGRYEFLIQGRIRANGTVDRPIVIHPAGDQPNRGDWVGMIFSSGGDANSILQYTEITHASWGIRLTGQDALIDHCTVTSCDSVGILCENLSSPDIFSSRMIDNSIAGILCQFNSSPRIVRNYITGGDGYGIYALESSRPQIKNNVFAGVGTDGVRLDNLSNATIHNNVFASNKYFGLYCENNSSPDVRNNIFYRNGSALRGGVGIFARFSSSPTIEWNDFWGNPVSAVSISGDTTYNLNNVVTDPMFENSSNGDYSLKTGSLCVNAGDPDARFNDVDGTRNDIGAFGGPEGE